MIEFTRKEIESAIQDLTGTIQVRRESYIKEPGEFTWKRMDESQNRKAVLVEMLKQDGDVFQI